MNPRSRIVRTALSHGLALAAGWAVYQGAASQGVFGGTGASSAAGMGAAPAKSAPRSPADEKAAAEILAKALKPAGNGGDPFADYEPYNDGARTEPPQTIKEYRDRIDSITVPEDIGAALVALTAEGGGLTQEGYADRAALTYHWLAKDPQGFFDWLKADRPRANAVGIDIQQIAPELYRRLGAEAVLPMIGMAGEMKYAVASMLATSVAKSGDKAAVLKARATLSGENWEYFSRNIGGQWPNDKLADLVKLAVECDEPLMAIGHRLHGDQGSYIAGLIADESLPEDFRQRLSENEFARQGLARDPKVPLELRVQDGGNLEGVLQSDVSRIMTEERDWAFAFRHGQATAQEVLDAVRAGTPEIAEKEPEALRTWVFRELAEENPAEAMKLLKDLPEAQRSEMALTYSRLHFNDVAPAKFLEMMQQVPADTAEQWEGRLDAWNARGYTNHERLKEGYVEWVQDLPPGIDREMGLYSLARAVQAANPELAVKLRNQVTDPALQKRITQRR
ncbi:hypothetical protein [Luteolibacter sp. Populi]|uniref:hypothetical protein n=1 Tax=Luteolibacter sp. Populi TaxID=3230487 RepID=UPI00346767E6